MTEFELATKVDITTAPMGRRSLILRRFLRNKPAIVGLTILILLFVAAFVLPHFLEWDHQMRDPRARLQPPSAEHPFGTTLIGQDVLAQTLRGLQKSLLIGFAVALISTSIAAIVGSVAGYLGGWTDRTIMWVVDLLLVVPSLIIIAIFTPRLKSSDSIVLLIVLLAVFGWMITARIVRGMTLSLRDREFVQAARYMGAPTWKIILSHIIPNIASILIIDATLSVGSAVLAETGLSYLGFGVQPPDVSLGSLIDVGTKSALTYPWLFLFAGGLLVLTVLSANLVGDGLRDAFDPSSKRARKKRKVK
ncbi:ABC transporter permease [Antrihabitans sp. YC2-6]|uniref:ABC transporter permease n=1 Tax=Antrihabitans sp. YC2-6 TaxID=2799498 RepID=UPI0018F360BF|nr:ABC transporter permease [Antrihabitans sp. YC2-6]MBJ8346272.1 ABC transporter permease [Antrihabitans sp. YC2-6]